MLVRNAVHDNAAATRRQRSHGRADHHRSSHADRYAHGERIDIPAIVIVIVMMVVVVVVMMSVIVVTIVVVVVVMVSVVVMTVVMMVAATTSI